MKQTETTTRSLDNLVQNDTSKSFLCSMVFCVSGRLADDIATRIGLLYTPVTEGNKVTNYFIDHFGLNSGLLLKEAICMTTIFYLAKRLNEISNSNSGSNIVLLGGVGSYAAAFSWEYFGNVSKYIF